MPSEISSRADFEVAAPIVAARLVAIGVDALREVPSGFWEHLRAARAEATDRREPIGSLFTLERPRASGFTATDIVALLCECNRHRFCNVHTQIEGTDAQKLLSYLAAYDVDRLDSLGLLDDVPNALSRDWTPPPSEIASWEDVTSGLPALYRGYRDDPRGWRGIFWSTDRQTAVEYTRVVAEGDDRFLATYRPRREDILAVHHVEDQVLLDPRGLQDDRVAIVRTDAPDFEDEVSLGDLPDLDSK